MTGRGLGGAGLGKPSMDTLVLEDKVKELSDRCESLVEDGTIDIDGIDKVLAFIQKKEKGLKAKEVKTSDVETASEQEVDDSSSSDDEDEKDGGSSSDSSSDDEEAQRPLDMPPKKSPKVLTPKKSPSPKVPKVKTETRTEEEEMKRKKTNARSKVNNRVKKIFEAMKERAHLLQIAGQHAALVAIVNHYNVEDTYLQRIYDKIIRDAKNGMMKSSDHEVDSQWKHYAEAIKELEPYLDDNKETKADALRNKHMAALSHGYYQLVDKEGKRRCEMDAPSSSSSSSSMKESQKKTKDKKRKADEDITAFMERASIADDDSDVEVIASPVPSPQPKKKSKPSPSTKKQATIKLVPEGGESATLSLQQIKKCLEIKKMMDAKDYGKLFECDKTDVNLYTKHAAMFD